MYYQKLIWPFRRTVVEKALAKMKESGVSIQGHGQT